MRCLSSRSSRLSLIALFAAAVAGVAGCMSLSLSSSGSGEPGASGVGGGLELPGTGGVGGSSNDSSTTSTGGNMTPPYLMGSYAYLCGGEKASCVPGNAVCSVIDPGTNDGGIGGTAPGSTGTGSGSTGSSTGSTGSGTGGAGGNADGTGGSTSGGSSDGGTLADLTCKLTPISGQATTTCVPPGDLAAGNACQTAADCGVGLACVATPSGGLCRPYCCGEVEACPVDTYCAPVAMAEAAVKIPVCIPAQKCKLLDNDTTCTGGQTCTIVRDDGTTSCVDPGDGSRGDSCPCTPGHVCSKFTNTCLKLCHIGNDAADCGAGSCQGGVMAYPDGIGICVGYP